MVLEEDHVLELIQEIVPCGLKNEQDKSCPKHCWVLVCSTAKVDPFGLNS